MILAAAQTKPKREDIQSNLEDHYNLIEQASDSGAGLIVFPEMSITGYERDRALDMAFTEEDSRLNELKKMSADRQIIVIAGAPVVIQDNLYIGAFIIKPDTTTSVYTKQFLHDGEELFFKSSFDYNPVIELENERISVAICADIDNPLHAENANKNRSTIYLASLFFSPNGMPKAYKTLSEYAKKYSMPVLMSNFSGQAWESEAGGLSGFWDKRGNLVANLNETDSGLLLMKKIDGTWTGKSIKYK